MGMDEYYDSYLMAFTRNFQNTNGRYEYLLCINKSSTNSHIIKTTHRSQTNCENKTLSYNASLINLTQKCDHSLESC